LAFAAIFTNKDFTSLSQLGESLKEHEMGKTGQFGKGFNSNYHIADIVQIARYGHFGL